MLWRAIRCLREYFTSLASTQQEAINSPNNDVKAPDNAKSLLGNTTFWLITSDIGSLALNNHLYTHKSYVSCLCLESLLAYLYVNALSHGDYKLDLDCPHMLLYHVNLPLSDSSHTLKLPFIRL